MDDERGPNGLDSDEPQFEELTAKLDEVLALLERGDLPLHQALSAYERGVELVRQCNDLLDRAELRVTQLSASVAGAGASDFERFLDELDDES